MGLCVRHHMRELPLDQQIAVGLLERDVDLPVEPERLGVAVSHPNLLQPVLDGGDERDVHAELAAGERQDPLDGLRGGRGRAVRLDDSLHGSSFCGREDPADAEILRPVRPIPRSREGAYLGRFPDRRVDMVGEIAAAACVGEPDEVAEERRVYSLAALVRGDPGELEQLVDFLLCQVQGGGIFATSRRQPIARLCEPVVHGVSLVPRGGERGHGLATLCSR